MQHIGKVALGLWLLTAGYLLAVQVQDWYTWRGQVTAAVNGILAEKAKGTN